MNRTIVSLLLLAAIGGAPARAATGISHALPAPVTDADYRGGGTADAAKAELGRMLFFDKVLSGNRNIACATCHHPQLGTSDALALGLGEGPTGLGRDRHPGPSKDQAVHDRVPRNSPALFNLGAEEFTVLFHDGRVEADPHGYYEGGFITPAKWKLPKGLESVLAAQAMFPVTSSAEMAGQKGENEVANASSLNNAAGPGGVWERLGRRLAAIPEYVELFRAAYPDEVKGPEDVTYVRAANAIAAFETATFRADESAFDRYLRGDKDAMDWPQKRGMDLFYGKANCNGCHSGKFQTDHDFHAIAMPQIGPGKADGRDATYWRASGQSAFVEDHGRGRVTMRDTDNYKFRTPSLRNVELTGPWGHTGAYATLEDVVRHHLDPVDALNAYQPAPDLLPETGPVLELAAAGSTLEVEYLSDNRQEGFRMRDTWVQEQDALRENIARANELEPVALTDGEVEDLIAFLGALTDSSFRERDDVVPERVPSGLPVED
jgi:cytochrome c peroxidase